MSRSCFSFTNTFSSLNIEPSTEEQESRKCVYVSLESDDRFQRDTNVLEEFKENPLSLWERILEESEEKMRACREWQKEKSASTPVVPHQEGPVEYLNKEIFPFLLPAMENMLAQAHQWKALRIQKCRFNGLDFLAEVLWNKNPLHPRRSLDWLDLYSIPPFKFWLRSHPRSIFPKSWLWSEQQATLHIQKWVRGWFVRKRDDVQEMRQFWKAIIEERTPRSSVQETIDSSDSRRIESFAAKENPVIQLSSNLNLVESHEMKRQNMSVQATSALDKT